MFEMLQICDKKNPAIESRIEVKLTLGGPHEMRQLEGITKRQTT